MRRTCVHAKRPLLPTAVAGEARKTTFLDAGLQPHPRLSAFLDRERTLISIGTPFSVDNRRSFQMRRPSRPRTSPQLARGASPAAEKAPHRGRLAATTRRAQLTICLKSRHFVTFWAKTAGLSGLSGSSCRRAHATLRSPRCGVPRARGQETNPTNPTNPTNAQGRPPAAGPGTGHRPGVEPPSRTLRAGCRGPPHARAASAEPEKRC